MASESREKTIVVEEEEVPASSWSGGSCISTAEEEKQNRKSVFISLRSYSDGARKNLVCDGESYYSTSRDGDGDGDDYDYNLPAENETYGIVYLEQEHALFFIGGYTFPRNYMKEVWIYNFQTDCFYAGPPMNRPRYSPTVLAYDKHIYVFGGSVSDWCFPEMNFMPPDHFVEVYDSVAKAWFYQSSQPPKEIILDRRSSIAAHALDEATGVVYFWTMPHGVYSYHIPSGSWSPFKLQGPCRYLDAWRGARWSNSTVLLHSFVVWSYCGSIYAYRVTDHLFLTLFTLPEPFKTEIGGPKDFLAYEPSPSYLVNVGDNKLCLVYGYQHNHDSHKLRCHTLEVQYSPVPLEFTLVHKGCLVCHCAEDFEIESVYAVNLDDVRTMKKKVLAVSRTLPARCVDPAMGSNRLSMLLETHPRTLPTPLIKVEPLPFADAKKVPRQPEFSECEKYPSKKIKCSGSKVDSLEN